MKFSYIEEDALKWELIEISETLKDLSIESTVLSKLTKFSDNHLKGYYSVISS